MGFFASFVQINSDGAVPIWARASIWGSLHYLGFVLGGGLQINNCIHIYIPVVQIHWLVSAHPIPSGGNTRGGNTSGGNALPSQIPEMDIF